MLEKEEARHQNGTVQIIKASILCVTHVLTTMALIAYEVVVYSVDSWMSDLHYITSSGAAFVCLDLLGSPLNTTPPNRRTASLGSSHP